MDTNLFTFIDYSNDPLGIVKEALNTFHHAYFIEYVSSFINKKEGVGDENGGCRFPNDLDEYELFNDYGGKPFEGVECWYQDYNIVVSEEEFFNVLRQACERYIELHPDEKDELQKIMAQSTLI